MTNRIKIDEHDLSLCLDDEAAQMHLASAYASKRRAICLCQPAGSEMYISRFGENRYVVKRMPNTGAMHAPECDSYEPPVDVTGAGQVLGSAIVDNPEDGATTLRVAFSLSKSPGRAPPVRGEPSTTMVAQRDGPRLSLRGLLHYLFDEARINRWSPSMATKRNWSVVRKLLLDAATGKSINGNALASLLYIPEQFLAARKQEINARRQAFVSRFLTSGNGPRPLIMLIGEVKHVVPARFGSRIAIKHAPDFLLHMDEKLDQQMRRKFRDEIDLCLSDPEMHLLAIATISLSSTSAGLVEQLVLMATTPEWVPVDSTHERTLLGVLTAQRRRFIKVLRYNISSSSPMAAAVLCDCDPTTLVYIVEGSDEAREITKADSLAHDPTLAALVWDTATDVPTFPPARNAPRSDRSVS